MWVPPFLLNCQKYLSTAIFCGISIALFAQASGNVRVSFFDPVGEVIPNVHAYSKDFSFSAFADEHGVVVIDTQVQVDSILFSSLGYKLQIHCANSLLQENLHSIQLEPLLQEASTVVVVGRSESRLADRHQKVEQIPSEDIRFELSQSSADVLDKHASVYVQKSQMGGGSPIIRGFEANRILLAVDGVRMNNLIYRSGHLQNAITIDPAILEELEVIHGPGALVYGSDALGGVLHYRTKSPKLRFKNQKAVNANASLRTSSANNELSIHADVNVGGNELASLTSISYSDFGDLRTGRTYDETYPDFGKRLFYVASGGNEPDQVLQNSDPHIQIGTAYSQLDLLQKFKWQPSAGYKQELNIQLSESSNIPRYDQLTIFNDGIPSALEWAEWDYGPQRRMLVASSHYLDRPSTWYDKSVIRASYQHIDESRITRRFASHNRFTQEEDVDIWALTADFQKRLQKLYGSFGAEASYNYLESEGSVESTQTGFERPDLSRYPDNGAGQFSGGLYANVQRQLTDIWNAQMGIRYSVVRNSLAYQVYSPLDWPERFYSGVSNTSHSCNWMLSSKIETQNKWYISGSLGTAFRAPNIDDLAKIRIKGAHSNAPNLDLKPERTLSADVTVRKSAKNNPNRWMQFNLYHTWINDAIVQDLIDLPNGDSLIFVDRVAYRVIGNVNAEEGYILGTSMSTKYALISRLFFNADVHYVYGRSTTGGVSRPLAHIPPLFGKAKLSYDNSQWKVSAVFRFNGKKDIDDFAPDSSDNAEFATVDGSLAWSTINFYSSYQINKTLDVQFAVENIMDRHYRPFSSGVSAPGRNFILALNAGI